MKLLCANCVHITKYKCFLNAKKKRTMKSRYIFFYVNTFAADDAFKRTLNEHTANVLKYIAQYLFI